MLKHKSTKLLLATAAIPFLSGVCLVVGTVYSLVSGMLSRSETSTAPIASRTMPAALSTQTEIGTPTPTTTVTASSSPSPTPKPYPQGLEGTVLFLRDSRIEYRFSSQPDSQLWMLDLATGVTTQLTDLPGSTTIDSSATIASLRVVAESKPAIRGLSILFIPTPEGCLATPETCSGFQFSPDGRSVAYTALVSPDKVWNTGGYEARVVDVATGEQVFSTMGGFWAWLGNDAIQVNSWWTEGATAAKVDTPSGARTELGMIGIDSRQWSPDGRAFAELTGIFGRQEVEFWVYDLNQERQHKPYVTEGRTSPLGPYDRHEGRYKNLCWTPDSSALIYNWQSITYSNPDLDYMGTMTLGPSQIWLMDRAGQERLMLSDPSLNYMMGCDWRGDALRILKSCYVPTEMPADYLGGNPATPSSTPVDVDCKQEKELIGLNWRTGDISSWVALTATPTVGFRERSFANPPIYSDPGHRFSLTTWANGTSLWYVPTQGEPFELVYNGHAFHYIAPISE